jgi:hypothetical protein
MNPFSREYAEQLLGLPMPPDDCTMEELYKWGVAGMFLASCREQGPIEGKILVTNFLLESSKEDDETMPLAKIIPYMEQALGRKLTAAELDRRRIDQV